MSVNVVRSVCARLSLRQPSYYDLFKQLIILFFCQLVIGAAFKFVSIYLSVDRPIFNLSYFIIPFFLFVNRWLGFFAALVIVILDLLHSISQTGMSGMAMLGLLKYLPMSGSYGIILLSSLLLLVLGITACVYHCYVRMSISAVILSFILIVCPSVICKKMDVAVLTTTGLPGLLVKKAIGLDVSTFNLFSFEAMFNPIVGGSFLQKNISGSDNKIVSVIVESMGVPLNLGVRRYFENKIVNGTGGRVLKSYETEFSGSTINGEVRELCSQSTDGVVISKIPDGVNCVPYVMSEKGFYTVAYHNNSGYFYDRFIWYPQAGFSEFRDGTLLLKSPHVIPSRVFNGVADRSVAEDIFANVRSKNKYFVHWTTMDTHAPYMNISSMQLAGSRFDCGKYKVNNELECNFIRQLDLALDDIMDLANKLPNTKFIISGDHAPRFQEFAPPADVVSATSHYSPDRVISFVINPIDN